MDRQTVLYQKICALSRREQLTDEDIARICSVLQSGLGQPRNPVDLSVAEAVHIDPDAL